MGAPALHSPRALRLARPGLRAVRGTAVRAAIRAVGALPLCGNASFGRPGAVVVRGPVVAVGLGVLGTRPVRTFLPGDLRGP
ncbi:hypothetical protein ADK76_14860 [Streptomyces griseoflavus]|nr:hypothetical protein ADK76_14860 [Streptomyces griseoflavus]